MMKLLSAEQVMKRIGIGRSSIWRMEQAGEFPARIRLSPNRVAWREDELETWIEARERPGCATAAAPEPGERR